MHATIRRLRTAALCAVLAATAQAQPLAAPQGEVVLTVTGAISQTNSGDGAVFDMEMLQALPAESFATSTIWTEGESEFTGVPLVALLDAVGAEGRVVRATAINDYAIEIPVADAVPGGPIVAYARDGAPMSLRDKGPLWVVYPYDANPDYQSETIYSRSIWQLDRLELLP